MKLDDIDRERYTLAMLALGWAYGALVAKRIPDPSEMKRLRELVTRVYYLNAEAEVKTPS